MRNPEQIKTECKAMKAAPEQRRAALESIAERRATLTRELAELDAMEAGHREALAEGGAL